MKIQFSALDGLGRNRITRRDFTAGLLGAGAGFTLGRVALAAGSEKIPPSVVGGLDIGVQSYTYRALTLEQMIASMRAVGLSNLELWTGHLDPAKHDEDRFHTTREKLDAAGIRVSAYCVNFRPGSSDELLDKAFRGAGILGTKSMTTSTEKAVVPKIDEYCQKYSVTMGLHNHWLGEAWFKGDPAQNFEGPDDFAEALEGRSKYIAINLDIGHFAAAGHDPVSYFKAHHERISCLHIKDRDDAKTRSNRRFGEGATPIQEVLQAAREHAWKGAVSIEYEIEENNPTPGVRHAFDYVKAALA